MWTPIPPEQQDCGLNVQSCKLRDHVTGELPILATLQTYCPEVNRKAELTLEKLKFITVFRQTAPVKLDSWILLKASKFYALMVILETRKICLVKSGVSHSRQRH